MKNCSICDQSFSGAQKSSENEKGHFYLMCKQCGQVYLVSKDDNGLSIIEKTKNGPEAMPQMIEAKKLFEAAGVGISQFKDSVHSKKTSSLELEEKETEEKKPDSFNDFFNDILGPIMSAIIEKRKAEEAAEEEIEEDNTEEEEDGVEAFMNGVSQAINTVFGKGRTRKDNCEGCSAEDSCANSDINLASFEYIVEVEKNGQRHCIRIKNEEELNRFIGKLTIEDTKIAGIFSLTNVPFKLSTVLELDI